MKLKHQLTAAFVAIAFLVGCTIFQSHTASQTFYSTVTATALQYLVPKAAVKAVADDFITASTLYDKFAGPDGVPTPAQATLLFNTYLPNTVYKQLATGTIMTIYWTYYPIWTKKDVSTQLGYLKDFLTGCAQGAQGYK